MNKRGRMPQRRSPTNGRSMEDTAGLLNAALAHHQAGRLAEANTLYSRVLAIAPKHPDVLHFLGLLACQINQHEAGLALMRESIVAYPSPIYHNNFGNALREAGRLSESIDAYRNAIALQHDYPEAHNNLGNA